MTRDYTPNERLKQWRRAKRLRQEDAADIAGISRTYYSKLESGQPIPLPVLERLHENGYDQRDDQAPHNPNTSPVFGQMHLIKIVTPQYFYDPEATGAVSTSTVAVPKIITSLGSKAWIIPAEDESMMPEYRPGDVIIFALNPARIAGYKYIISDGTTAQIRTLVWNRDQWETSAANPNKERYPDEPLGSRKVAAIVLGFYRKEVDLESVQASPNGLR